ncbi:receptor-like protein 49 [Rhodamnia argentea]|uniref:Receptor-like protein 49 n=1 Tax=Rhodamnia argentea TaxID=178133 RepID=A0ABM3GXD7_9MYRT|nr:receptor-like protein 49 [Rhodamnia argentea]
MIQGVIPGKIARDSNLRTLDFSRNRFEGTLPRSLLQCKSLEVLDLSNNRTEDTFPDWLETLPKLQVLVLRSNKFHGFVRSPRAARPFPELRIFDLSNNNFSGPLPVRYIMKLTCHDESGKRVGKAAVHGSLGLSRFSHCDHERTRDTSGYIPPSTGNLTDLEWLDLSSNKFIGRIPQELVDLTSLAFLNLLENRLIGLIPRGPQFNTFKNDLFAENPGLCGFPLPKTCKNSSRETPSETIMQENDTKHGGWFEWRTILMGYGCGTVVGITLGYVLIDSKKLEWLARSFDRKGAKMRRKSRRNARRSYQR